MDMFSSRQARDLGIVTIDQLVRDGETITTLSRREMMGRVDDVRAMAKRSRASTRNFSRLHELRIFCFHSLQTQSSWMCVFGHVHAPDLYTHRPPN